MVRVRRRRRAGAGRCHGRTTRAGGRTAIARLTREYIDFGASEFREEITDFYGNGELQIDQGNDVMVYGPDQVVERGKYPNVWKMEGGTWKIQSNIWNANAPAAAAR